MEINIAGAGAGKTTKMSDKIILLRNQIDAEKKIFCVAFTNVCIVFIESCANIMYKFRKT